MQASRPSIALIILLLAICSLGNVLCPCDRFANAEDPVSLAPGGNLEILPRSVVVTADYPAHFSVWWRLPDGRAVDISNRPELRIAIEQPAIADSVGSRIQSRSLGTTRLIARLGESADSVELLSTADTELAFDREVLSVLTRSGCNLGTCHGNLHGKGGMRLSLRGDDPAFDHYRLAVEYSQRRIDPWEPAASLILQKATGSLAHQGGKRFDTESPEAGFLTRWIAAGATPSQSPTLTRLEVYPKQALLPHGVRTTRVIVQAHFADGSIRDVTHWARMEPNLPSGVAIGDQGEVAVEQPTDVTLSISYLSGRTAARLVFLGSDEAISSPVQETTSDAAVAAQHRIATSTPIAASNPIDTLIAEQCRTLRIALEPPADDWTWIRRVTLASIGRLPTPEETLAFVNDNDPMRIERTVDRLLADPGLDYAWALRWSDLLRNEEKVMSPRGARELHQWLREQIASDRPLRDWIGQLLSSTGSTYENPPASFHRTHRDPFIAAESSAQVFLGVRIQCAKCHNHPFDAWRQDDYYGLAAYFTTIDRKQIDNKPKDELDKHIITGDEIISLSERKPEIKHPGRSRMVEPQPLATPMPSGTSMPNGSTATGMPANSIEAQPENGSPASPESATVLEEFARWLTRDNAQFDANLANRIWFQYFGRGIVDPPDDFRDSNPPSNPALLDWLATELRQSDYSMKRLSRLILTSDTFARRSTGDLVPPTALNPVPYFSGYPIRRLQAEALMDALSEATGAIDRLRGIGEEEDAAPITHAMRMPGVPRRPGFLTAFGKPNRLLVCECERSNAVSLGQSLVMVNGREVREKLAARQNRIDDLIRSGREDSEILDELFLASLCRLPSETEREASLELLRSISDRPQSIDAAVLAIRQQLTATSYRRRRAFEDILWALLNSKEFLLLR